MIDLSTLIALLTALASAAAPSQPGSLDPRASEPPGQHCSAAPPTAPSGSTRSAPIDQLPEGPRTRSLSPPDPESRPETPSDDGESESPTTRNLHGDSDDNGDEPDTTTTTRAPRPESGRTDDEADSPSPEEQSTTPRHSTEPQQPITPRRSTTQRQPTTTPQHPGTTRRQPTAESLPSPTTTPATRKPGATDEGPSESTGSPQRTPAPGSGRSADRTDSTDGRSADDTSCLDPPRELPSDPAPDPSTDASTDAPTRDIELPSDVVDLGNWYLTLPTGPEGDPDTVQPGKLAGYSSAYFQLNEGRDGVVFTAPVDGATTRNSSYPRSELREMNGTEEAAWSNGSGTHTLRATEAVTELPESKPELVTAQIHGGDDDVMQIRLEGSRLMVQYADGAEHITLDPDYRLGTPYDIEIVAAASSVRVGYNGELKAELPLSGSTWYFKAGAYVQSNPTKGDTATAAGQVVIYSLEVDHR